MPSFCASARVHARPGRPRLLRLLQRRRAAHQRIGEVDRHFGDALDAAGCSGPAATRRSDAGCERRARCRRCPRQRRAHLLGAVELEPGSPSRLPSTRSTFQAGRASPSGCTRGVEALRAAFGVDEGAGGFGERRDRQHHVGAYRARDARKGDIATTNSALDAERARGSARSSSARRRGRTQRLLAHAPRRQRAPIGRRRRHSRRRVGRFAEEPDRAPVSSASACAAACIARGLRMLLREVAEEHRGVLAAPSTARRWNAAIAPGAASRRATPPILREATRHQPVVVDRVQQVRPARRAWPPGAGGARSADASLRRNEPMTSTRSSAPSSAIVMPSHGTPARLPSAEKSLWRRRKSAAVPSLPSEDRALRASECGERRSMPTSRPFRPARDEVERLLPVDLLPLAARASSSGAAAARAS